MKKQTQEEKNYKKMFSTLNNNYQGIRPMAKTKRPNCVPFPHKGK
jgi:hypothetical protein